MSVLVFHGEDNSASDDDDLTDGRRMIKVKGREEREGKGERETLKESGKPRRLQLE